MEEVTTIDAAIAEAKSNVASLQTELAALDVAGNPTLEMAKNSDRLVASINSEKRKIGELTAKRNLAELHRLHSIESEARHAFATATAALLGARERMIEVLRPLIVFVHLTDCVEQTIEVSEAKKAVAKAEHQHTTARTNRIAHAIRYQLMTENNNMEKHST